MWKKSENGETIKPAAIEYCGDIVIVRRRFKLVEATEEKPAHYEFEEWQMTKEAYEVYKYFEGIASEQSDALIELADIIIENAEAIEEPVESDDVPEIAEEETVEEGDE